MANVTRSLHAFILLTVLLWQSWVTVGVVSVGVHADAPVLAAILVDDSNTAADLTVHMDADEAPVQHVDGGAGGNELLSAYWPRFFLARSLKLPEFVVRHWRSVPAEGLLRPPRLFA
jgi:hypothetical protein